MSEKKNGFYFDTIRPSADNLERVVIQGYAEDGFPYGQRPRAAFFVGKKPVKALNVKLEIVKLPPLYYRRREGKTMSYLALFYVDVSGISRRMAEKVGAKLVIITEDKNKNRCRIYVGSMLKAVDKLFSYSFMVNDAYTKDGRTYLGGWMGGDEATVIRIEPLEKTDKDTTVGVDGAKRVGTVEKKAPLDYQLEMIPHNEIAVQFPEIENREKLGFVVSVEGEYKKLSLTMTRGVKSSTSIITTGKSNFELDSSNNLVRYSGKIARNLKNYGVKETANKIMLHMYLPVLTLNRKYNKWIQKQRFDKEMLNKERSEQADFKFRPLLSLLVPLYETDEKFLDELITSVKEQTYDNWEICFSDGSENSDRLSKIIKKYSDEDSRIRYIAEKQGPLGISANTNQAFSIAKGEFIILGDHDDLLYPSAFYNVVKPMNEKKGSEIDVVYTDEDKTNMIASRRFEPSIKPDYNQLFLESCNYITHMFVVRKSIVDEIKGFDEKCDGAQDYDFILRCVEKARRVYHVNKVLYSWRISSTSTAGDPKVKMYAYDSGVRALQSHYDRIGIPARAEIGDHLGYYHTQYGISGNPTLYVVVINAADEEKYKKTVKSIESKTDYKDIRFIRISEKGTKCYGQQLNQGLEQVEKKISEAGLDKENCYVAFMEAGITMMGEDDLSGMLGMLSSRNDISVVGGKVYCANGTVAHAGVILCTDKVYGYEFMSQSISKDVYFNHSQYSALRQGVTLFRLKDLMECGSFSTDYTGGYSMIDYTLRMSDAGHKCIYSANANFYIDISKGLDATAVFSSGNEAEDEKLFYKKNANLLENGDLYYTV